MLLSGRLQTNRPEIARLPSSEKGLPANVAKHSSAGESANDDPRSLTGH